VVACWGLVAHVFGPTASFGAQSDRFTKPPSHQLLSSCRADARAPCRGQRWLSATAVTDRIGCTCGAALQPQQAAATQRRRAVASPDRDGNEWSHRWVLRTKCKEGSVSQPCRIESVLANLEIVISDMAMLLRPPTKPVHQRWQAGGPDVVTRQRSYLSSWTRLCQYQDAPVRRLELQSQQSLGYLK
jgi:hypothetical protein